MLEVVKAVYMPFRRVWLDDDEACHPSDYKWIIFMPTFTVFVMVMCFMVTISN